MIERRKQEIRAQKATEDPRDEQEENQRVQIDTGTRSSAALPRRCRCPEQCRGAILFRPFRIYQQSSGEAGGVSAGAQEARAGRLQREVVAARAPDVRLDALPCVSADTRNGQVRRNHR